MKSPLKSYGSLLILLLSLCACSNEVKVSPLEPYYQESCNLPKATLDSICSFAEKFYCFTADGTYNNDPLYQPTVDNIDNSKVSVSVTINMNGEWEEDDELIIF